MSARKHSIRSIAAALAHGHHVVLTGMAGSGRTHFIAGLSEALRDRHWAVSVLGGRRVYQEIPFAALVFAGLVEEPSQNGSTIARIQSAAEQLARRLDADPAVLLIDDAHDVDEASWAAVIECLRMVPGARILLAGTSGAELHERAEMLHAMTFTLPPITHRELRVSLESKLGAPVEDFSLGQIFARSGASAGLAHDLVDAAVLSGHLRRSGREWSINGTLWSDTLSGALERLMVSLGSPERDALEVLAIAGVSDLAAVRPLIDEHMIERLELSGLVRVSLVKGRLCAAVHPPLLEDYFRHRQGLARRARIDEAVSSTIREPNGWSLGTSPEFAGFPGQENAVTAGLFQAQAQARMTIARSEWEADPTAATAVTAVRSMIAVRASDAEVQRVLDTEITLNGGDRSATYLLIHRAEWRAIVHHDLEGALDMLRDSGDPGTHQRRLTDAGAVSLEHTLLRVPEDYRERLRVCDELPLVDQMRLLRTRVLIETSRGDFAQAAAVLAEAAALPCADEDFGFSALHGLVQVGTGELSDAIDWTRGGVSRAITGLDPLALRSHGAVLVYALEAAGRYAEAEEVLATLLPLTYPPRSVSASAMNVELLGCAALIAARRGRREQAQRHLDSLADLGAPGVPLPNLKPVEAEAQLLISLHQRDAAAQLLWDRGQDFMVRGFRFPGLLLQLAALEALPDPDRLAQFEAEATSADLATPFVAGYLTAVRYLHDPQPSRAEEVAAGVAAAGRTGLALAILDQAILEASSELAAHLREVRELITDREPGIVFETSRFAHCRTRLTDREAEVARLVAEGRSNREIANLLVVSVRTVESHLARIMRKLNISARSDITESQLPS